MPAGYSGTPLAKKLGIKPGTKVATLGAPANYSELLEPLPEGAEISDEPGESAAFLHFFTTERVELEGELPRLKELLVKDGNPLDLVAQEGGEGADRRRWQRRPCGRPQRRSGRRQGLRRRRDLVRPQVRLLGWQIASLG